MVGWLIREVHSKVLCVSVVTAFELPCPLLELLINKMAIAVTAACVLLLCLTSMVFAPPVITGEKKPGKDVENRKFEAGVPFISSTSLFNWTSVPISSLGDIALTVPETLSFIIPSIIPSDAKEVLLYVGVYSGDQAIKEQMQSVKIFTQIGRNTYAKYLMLYTFPENAVNSNSDNMWFPMPPNRSVLLTLTDKLNGNAYAQLSAIGYR